MTPMAGLGIGTPAGTYGPRLSGLRLRSGPNRILKWCQIAIRSESPIGRCISAFGARPGIPCLEPRYAQIIECHLGVNLGADALSFEDEGHRGGPIRLTRGRASPHGARANPPAGVGQQSQTTLRRSRDTGIRQVCAQTGMRPVARHARQGHCQHVGVARPHPL